MENPIKTIEDKNQVLQWIENLKSGKYPQTTSALQNQKGFCCLGVACDLFIEQNLKILNTDNCLTGATPISQIHSPQWTKKIDEYINNKAGYSLIQLNDEYHYSFVSIAQEIEELLKEELNAIQ